MVVVILESVLTCPECGHVDALTTEERKKQMTEHANQMVPQNPTLQVPPKKEKSWTWVWLMVIAIVLTANGVVTMLGGIPVKAESQKWEYAGEFATDSQLATKFTEAGEKGQHASLAILMIVLCVVVFAGLHLLASRTLWRNVPTIWSHLGGSSRRPVQASR